MKQNEPRRTAVFVWSLPEDPRFLEWLRRKHGDFLVCCMDFCALQTARRFVPADRIVDVMSMVPAAEREAMDIESSALFNRFWRELLRYRNEPWLACLEFMNDGNFFYYALLWKRVLERVSELTRGGGIRFYGPFSRGAWPGSMIFGVDLMEIMVMRSPASGGAASRPSLPKRLLKRALMCSGGWVNRFARACSTGPASSRGETKHADILVCGLQETDRLVQTELVRRLGLRGLGGFRWLVLSRGRLPVSADEAQSGAGDSLSAVRDEVEGFGCFQWRHPWLEFLSRRHVRHRFLGAIRAAGAGLDEDTCESLADAMETRHARVRLRYLEIDELLRPYAPSLVVGSSVVDEMICVREWARRHKVPFVRFPHGVEYFYKDEIEWDAECVGVFGEDVRESLLRAGTAPAERIEVVGGMHLAAQSNRGVSWSADAWSRNPWRCSMLGSFAAYMDYPDTASECQEDVLGLARAANRQGGAFGVRLHPRQSDWDGPVYQSIARAAAESGIRLDFSNSNDSLSSELASAAFALIRVWSGAGIVALYVGVPLIGWVPRPGLPESSGIVGRLPLHAASVVEFERIVSRLRTDAAFRAESLDAQKKFLERLILDPWGDPWARAVDLVMVKASGGVGGRL